MSAPADIMSRKRSATRPANMVAAWFKNFLVNLFVALDETQRKRASDIIQRYRFLIPERDVNSGEQKKSLLSEEVGYESRKFWSDIPWS
jgi:hypothetical protein